MRRPPRSTRSDTLFPYTALFRSIPAGLMPEQPEVLGLLALVEIQASRLAARAGPDVRFVPLTWQNRARWDQLLIRRGLNALDRAEALGAADGPYALQAALAACHARARKIGRAHV